LQQEQLEQQHQQQTDSHINLALSNCFPKCQSAHDGFVLVTKVLRHAWLMGAFMHPTSVPCKQPTVQL
jgi:hypothetical protein